MLVLAERLTQDINDSLGTAEKKICINSTKANTKFALILYYNGDENYLCANKTEICKFKVHDVDFV